MANIKLFLAGRRYDHELFLSTLDDIVRLVVKRHFAFDDSWEDVRAIGLCKCIKLLRSDYLDLRKGRLMNFLYSGVRNEIGNYRRSEQRRLTRFEVDTERVERDESTDTNYLEGRDMLTKHLQKVTASFERFGVDMQTPAASFGQHYDLAKTSRYFTAALRVAAWRASREMEAL